MISTYIVNPIQYEIKAEVFVTKMLIEKISGTSAKVASYLTEKFIRALSAEKNMAVL